MRGTALAVALAALAAPPAAADWKTVESAHVRVHVPEEMVDVGLRAAALAERALPGIMRALDWRPADKIDVALGDHLDRPNARASVLPRNEVLGAVAPPEPNSTLNDFDDWLAVMVAHELTHVVHLDVALGLVRVLNAATGKVWAPNLVAPGWLLEGLAVLEESSRTGAGRARSTMSDMYLRVAALEGALLDLDVASNEPLAFPRGVAPYLYGGAFVSWVADRYGVEKLREIAHRQGGTLAPLGVNRTARRALGAGYDELWGQWRDETVRRARLEAALVAREGITPAARVTFDGEGNAGSLAPRFLPDGSLVYLLATSRERPRYLRLDLATGRRQTLLETHAAGPAAPTPDGRALIFQRLAPARLAQRILGAAHAEHDELFRLDLASREVAPVAPGRRLQQPAVAPDGARVASVRLRPGGSDLVILGGGAATPIGGGPQAVYSPAWSPDGQTIAYVRAAVGGTRDPWLRDVASGRERPVVEDRAIEADPTFSPDGRYLLFSSDRTGIYNVYAHELATGALWQVTNVVGGAFQPAVSPDGRTLVFVGFTAAGFDLFAMPYRPEAWRPAPPSVRGEPDPPPPPPPPAARVGPYRPLRHLDPRAWNLYASSDPLGLGPGFGVDFVVDDPARIHTFGLAVDVALDGPPSARLDWVWDRWAPSIRLLAYHSTTAAGDLQVGGEARAFRQHAAGGGLRAELPLVRTADRGLTAGLAYDARHTRLAEALPPGPEVRAPALGLDTRVRARLAYDDVRAWTLSVGPQEGRAVEVAVERAEPALGGRWRSTAVSWRWTEYLTPPWATLQSIALAYRGGWAGGDGPPLWALGGFVQQDVLRAFFLDAPQAGLHLRGYPVASLVGTRFHAGSLEYRAPLVWIERGHGTFPLYLRRLHGALFVDAGTAFSGAFRPGDVRVGTGAELRLDFTLAWRLENQVALGAARGLGPGGVTDVYLVTSVPF